MVQYYHVCQRELWFASRGLDIDREAVSKVGEVRNDRLGATARVLVALSRDERPTDADLIAAGLPTPSWMESGKRVLRRVRRVGLFS